MTNNIVSGIKHREILEALNDAIHVIDRELKIVFQNPAFSRWLSELSLNPEIEGLQIAEAFPFISEETIDEYHYVFSTGLVHHNSEETEVDGKTVYTEITKIPLVRNGSVEQIVTVIRDVTEQKMAQLAIQEESEKAQMYLDVAAVILVALDTGGNINLLNQKGLSLLDYKEEEIMGKN
ncbi:MAG: PAS domain-containing protein, partial [Candidatus Thorarchaeota archaeon]